MQLADIVKPIDKMNDEELLAYLREVRHRREVIRPAAMKRAERATTKAARGKATSVDKQLASLSDAERELLIAKLLEQENNS